MLTRKRREGLPADAAGQAASDGERRRAKAGGVVALPRGEWREVHGVLASAAIAEPTYAAYYHVGSGPGCPRPPLAAEPGGGRGVRRSLGGSSADVIASTSMSAGSAGRLHGRRTSHGAASKCVSCVRRSDPNNFGHNMCFSTRE